MSVKFCSSNGDLEEHHLTFTLWKMIFKVHKCSKETRTWYQRPKASDLTSPSGRTKKETQCMRLRLAYERDTKEEGRGLTV